MTRASASTASRKPGWCDRISLIRDAARGFWGLNMGPERNRGKGRLDSAPGGAIPAAQTPWR